MKPFLFLLLTCSLAQAEPRKPADRILDPNATMPVAIHPSATTLLVFPEPVTLVVGAGLSDGSTPGDVHYQHAKNPKHLVLRQLTAGSTVLMQIAMGEQTYAFELSTGDRPDNIIRFHQNPALGPAVELDEEQVRQQMLDVPEERQFQLTRLVEGESFLRPTLAAAYEDYFSTKVSYTSENHDLQVTIHRVARFAQEDSIILVAKIENLSSHPIDLSNRQASVLVGEQQIALSPTFLAASQNTIPPGEQIDCSVVLVGDGHGQRLHLDPRKNRFLLTFTPSKP